MHSPSSVECTYSKATVLSVWARAYNQEYTFSSSLLRNPPLLLPAKCEHIHKCPPLQLPQKSNNDDKMTKSKFKLKLLKGLLRKLTFWLETAKKSRDKPSRAAIVVGSSGILNETMTNWVSFGRENGGKFKSSHGNNLGSDKCCQALIILTLGF